MNTNTVAKNTAHIQVAPRLAANNRKSRRGKRSALINQTDTMLCKAKPLKTKRNDKSQLELIARDLWLSKQSFEQFKKKYDGLRENALNLMAPGSVYKSEYGKLKYNGSKTRTRLNKEMLCKELCKKGFTPSEVKEILAASVEKTKSRAYIAFYSNKTRRG